jgi:hypothetical protein
MQDYFVIVAKYNFVLPVCKTFVFPNPSVAFVAHFTNEIYALWFLSRSTPDHIGL